MLLKLTDPTDLEDVIRVFRLFLADEYGKVDYLLIEEPDVLRNPLANSGVTVQIWKLRSVESKYMLLVDGFKGIYKWGNSLGNDSALGCHRHHQTK